MYTLILSSIYLLSSGFWASGPTVVSPGHSLAECETVAKVIKEQQQSLHTAQVPHSRRVQIEWTCLPAAGK